MAAILIKQTNNYIGEAADLAGLSTTGLPAGSKFYEWDTKLLKVWNGATWTKMPTTSATLDDLTLLGSLIFTPSTTQVIDAAGDAILANATLVVLNPDADYTLTSTPTIANGTIGQLLYITCANAEANTVTIQDQDTLGSSNLQLLGTTKEITGKAITTFMFDGTNWIEYGGGVVVPLELASTLTTSYNMINMTPGGALGASAVFKGIYLDGAALDPSAAAAEIHAIDIDLSGVSLANEPILEGAHIVMPTTYSGQERLNAARFEGNGMLVEIIDNDKGQNVIHTEGGHVDIDRDLPSTINSTFEGIGIDVDVSNLAATSTFHALDVIAVGSTSGEVAAIGAFPGVQVIRQYVGAFATPNQTNYAARFPNGGAWTAGIDGQTIFVANNDEIYIGSVSTFSELEVIFTTPASKDVRPEFFFYNTALTWIEFFPEDTTNGWQIDGIIEWNSTNLTNWKSDFNPGGGGAGYFIKVKRTRSGSLTSPVPTTVKILDPTTYGWDAEADLTVRSFDQIGDATNKTAISTTGVLTYSGSARPTRNIVLGQRPTAYADGADNAGTVTPQHDNTNDRNYYRWSSGTANQDIDLVWEFQLPANFAAFTASSAFYIDVRSNSAAGHVLTASLYDAAGAVDPGIDGASIIPDADNTWQSKSDLPTASYSANDWIHFHVHYDVDDIDDTLDVSRVYFTYLASN